MKKTLASDLRPEDADFMCKDCFTPDEIDAVRRDLESGVAAAVGERSKRRTPIHPRIVEAGQSKKAEAPTTFGAEDAARHRLAMMNAEFAEKADAMRQFGASDEEIAIVRSRAVRLKQGAPFLRWIGDKQKGRTPEWMDDEKAMMEAEFPATKL